MINHVDGGWFDTPPPPRELTPRNILLMEDDGLVRMNTADMLQELGHVVIEAPTAEDALVALEMAAVDILITDVNLPGMSGQKLAEKARLTRIDIGVIFATGDAHVEGSGECEILNKPYSQEQLNDAVASMAKWKNLQES